MFLPLIQKYKRFIPRFKGLLFKMIYSHTNFKVGKNFQCNSFPEVTIDKNSKIIIGDNVLFRRNVELRAHNNSKIIFGNNIRVDRGVRILSANKSEINIKEGVRIGLYSVFNGGDSIYIGEKSLISGFVYLQTSMHKFNKNIDIQNQGYSHLPIHIDKDVWLGTHAVILPGCDLAEGAIIGSNAVVTKRVDKGVIVGGVPAKKINNRC
ncbi:MAG: acyltransferase [Bacteroidetes bacterium]|nr:acyltransferase [Bacteroidota bacterium]